MGARSKRHDPPGRDDVHERLVVPQRRLASARRTSSSPTPRATSISGQAAHCSSTGEDTETNGCTTKSLPLGTPIYSGDLVNGGVQDGTKIGTLAYNSWITMQKAKEKDANTCAYNDLALIKIAAIAGRQRQSDGAVLGRP